MGLPAEAEQRGGRLCGGSGTLFYLPARGSALTVLHGKLQTGANTVVAPRRSQPGWSEPVHFEDEDGRMVFSPPFPKLGAQRVGPNPFSSSPSLPPSPPWPTSQALALSTLRAVFLPVEHLTINAFSQVPPKPASRSPNDPHPEQQPHGGGASSKVPTMASRTVTVHMNGPPGKATPLLGHRTHRPSDWRQCRW